MEEDQDNTVIGSTFPPPPPHHLKFTSHNLRLLALLQAASTSPASPSTDRKGKQREILADESDVPEWDLETELVPPRVDWVEEDGGYECYGAFYPVSPSSTSGRGVHPPLPLRQSLVLQGARRN